MEVPSVADIARRYVEDAVWTGKFRPGCQVKEEIVADALGISRPPIREAFKLLEAEGLLRRVPRKGVFVTEIKEKDVMEIYTLKAELYAFSIQRSFQGLSSADVDRMGDIVFNMEAVVAQASHHIESYQELNIAFHNIHVDNADHQRMKRILQNLHNQIRYYSSQTLLNRHHIVTSCQYHRRIFEAFRMGDMASAIALTREHVLVALQRFGFSTPNP